MVEPQLFLQLLMRLFTDPSRLDGSCQRLERNVSGQVRDVVLLLSARTSFAQNPHFIARHTLDTFIEHAVLGAVRDADAPCSEEACQRAFRAPAPTDLLPFFADQHHLSRNWGHIRDMVFARLTGFLRRKDHGDIGRIDFLAPRHTNCPQEATFAQSKTERCARSVSCVRQHTAEANTGCDHAIDLGQRDLWLRPCCAMLDWNAGTLQTYRIARPTLGNEET